MVQDTQSVDMISVCSADGEIRPLRFRMEDENQVRMRVDIDEVLSIKEIPYIGAEAQIFLCKAMVWDREWLFELKYTIRSHTWCLLRRLR